MNYLEYTSSLAEIIRLHQQWQNSAGIEGRPLNLCAVDLRGVDFTNANLTDANLSGANLTRARLDGANLTAANLGGAKVNWVDLIKVRIEPLEGRLKG